MEKTTRRALWAIISLTAGFLIFLGGFYAGRGYLLNGYTVTTEMQNTVPPTVAISEQPLNSDLMVNINTATNAELEELNGIGPALAERIIEYRNTIGGFKQTYELLDVSGIGVSVYEKIRNNITVGEET